MPDDSGVAFVLVPHLDPTHESLLVELLARQTRMPVVEAKEGTAVEADHVDRDITERKKALSHLEQEVERRPV